MKTNYTTKRRVSSLLKSVLILSAALTLSLGSCKKDSSNNEAAPANTPATPSKSDLLSAKAWKLSSSTVSPAIMGETDMYAMMQSCEKDNTLKFNADKSFVNDEGPTKCNAMDPQGAMGTWKLSTDEATLTLSNMSQNTAYTLLNVSSTSLKISSTMVYNGTTYTITNTYGNN